MKKKLVIQGTNANEEKIFIALELLAEENKIALNVFPESVVTESVFQFLLKEWKDKGADLPEGSQIIERELTVTSSILPDDIKTEDTALVNRAQTEWQFIVLSVKLQKVYMQEVEEFMEKIDQLETYSSGVWNDLKEFWSKVQGQIRDRNLFREHGDQLRNKTNVLFDKMKALRADLDKEFEKNSTENKANFLGQIKIIEEKLTSGARLSALFEELKSIQNKFRTTKFTKADRSNVWDAIDGAFKAVKQKRFGDQADNSKKGFSGLDRINKRYDGLLGAIQKMERSIARDVKDLEFENRRMANTDGQLEAQIRQAKVNMIQQRIDSKNAKLEEMNATKKELDDKKVVLAEKEAKAKERQEKEAAKEAAKIAAKAKIAEDIKEQTTNISPEQAEKLEKAAELVASGKKTTVPVETKIETPKTPNVENKPSGDAIIDNIAAISSIITDK